MESKRDRIEPLHIVITAKDEKDTLDEKFAKQIKDYKGFELDISSSNLSVPQVNTLFELLKKSPCITKLKYADYPEKTSTEVRLALATNLGSIQTLQCLDLIDSNGFTNDFFGNDSSQYVIQYILKTNKFLKELYIGRKKQPNSDDINDVMDFHGGLYTISTIAETLTPSDLGNTTLTALHLTGVYNVDPSTAKSLRNMLTANRTLQVLDINDMSIVVAEVCSTHLREGFNYNPSLQEIYLTNIRFPIGLRASKLLPDNEKWILSILDGIEKGACSVLQVTTTQPSDKLEARVQEILRKRPATTPLTRSQKQAFLMGLRDKNSSVSTLSKNTMFDKQLLKLIFSSHEQPTGKKSNTKGKKKP